MAFHLGGGGGFKALTGGVAGDEDITVLVHPIFVAGQVVHYHGKEAEVISDNGNTVRNPLPAPAPAMPRQGEPNED